MTTPENTHPWEQLPGEPAIAFKRFTIYLDAGSFTKAAPIIAAQAIADKARNAAASRVTNPAGKGKGRNLAVVPDLPQPTAAQIRNAEERCTSDSRKYGWQERRRAWLNHVDGLRRAEAAREHLDVLRDQAAQLQAARLVISGPVVELLKRLDDAQASGEDPYEALSNMELLQMSMIVARVFPALMEAEQKARGVADVMAEKLMVGPEDVGERSDAPLVLDMETVRDAWRTLDRALPKRKPTGAQRRKAARQIEAAGGS